MNMVQVAWATVGLLGVSVFGMFAAVFFLVQRMDSRFDALGAKIDLLDGRIDGVNDSLGARIDRVDDSLGARIDSLNENLGARIDALGARLDGRIDSLSVQLQAHIERHAT